MIPNSCWSFSVSLTRQTVLIRNMTFISLPCQELAGLQNNCYYSRKICRTFSSFFLDTKWSPYTITWRTVFKRNRFVNYWLKFQIIHKFLKDYLKTLHVPMLSSVLLLVTPWTVAHQVPLSVEFCRQEYWSGLPFSTPGNLPHPGIEPVSPALAGGLFTITVTWGDLSFQHKHNHFNTYVYVCVFEPMNKQTKK